MNGHSERHRNFSYYEITPMSLDDPQPSGDAVHIFWGLTRGR